ncbi:MAG: RNA polymerase II mediator complex subunit [Chrysothrix sp. TS-e1954]|nr:MAG: RNA polymerase II mediator complex subunit [Chrysothrix sp. TS-e1954]
MSTLPCISDEATKGGLDERGRHALGPPRTRLLKAVTSPVHVGSERPLTQKSDPDDQVYEPTPRSPQQSHEEQGHHKTIGQTQSGLQREPAHSTRTDVSHEAWRLAAHTSTVGASSPQSQPRSASSAVPLALPARPRLRKRRSSRYDGPFDDHTGSRHLRQIHSTDSRKSERGSTGINASVLDSYPWTGQHPEDELSEHNVKNGLFSKQQVLNESNTARSGLWPHVKNPAGLQALSCLFISAQQKRQDAAILSTTSTFRPPPRVALTDSKRSNWLSDLADDKVPLRRLSRTIPHGVRGRDLLDACLNHRIPLPRAIWLAKCVGANELRAFRRKGISRAVAADNESRWIRDWTSILESFMECTLYETPRGEQTARARYVLQLVSCLYTEGLLDHAHVLDWTLETIAGSQWNSLPMALLVADIFWKPLTRNFGNGQRLMHLLLNRVSTLRNVVQESIRPLRARIILYCQRLVSRNQTFLLQHFDWRPLVSHLGVGLSGLAERSYRTNSPRNAVSGADSETSILSIIEKLSTAHLASSTDDLLRERNGVSVNTEVFVDTLFRWSCSMYCHFSQRQHVALRALRRMTETSKLSSAMIYDSLQRIEVYDDVATPALNRLLANLVTAQAFDPGIYLRSLVSTGALSGMSYEEIRKSCITSFLLDVPMDPQNNTVLNFRNQLLRHGRIRVNEAEQIQHIKIAVAVQLPRFFGNYIRTDQSQPAGPLRDSLAVSITVQAHLSHWILQDVASTFAEWRKSVPDARLSVTEVVFLLGFFRKTSDYVGLVRLIQICLPFSEVDVLLVIVDSIFGDCSTLLAMHALSFLFKSSLGRYQAIRREEPPSKDLVLSLHKVAQLCSTENEHSTQYWQQELDILKQSAGVTVCTPASEGLLDSNQEAPHEMEDEIEQIFSSGTAMDRQSIELVFETIITRFKRYEKDVQIHVWTSAEHLKRLREYGEEQFDELMERWVRSQMMTDKDRISLRILEPALVGCTCLALSKLISCSLKLLAAQTGDVETSIMSALDILELINNDDEETTALELPLQPNNECATPTFRLQALSHLQALRYRTRAEEARRILRLTFQVTTVISESSSPTSARFEAICAALELLETLRSSIVEYPEEAVAIGKEYGTGSALMTRLVYKIVNPRAKPNLDQVSSVQIVQHMFENVNAFNIGLYRFATAAVVHGKCREDAISDALTTSLFGAAKSAAVAGKAFWPDLVADLPADLPVALRLREYSEKALLTESTSTNKDMHHTPREYVDFYQTHERILAKTAATIPSKGVLSIATSITAALRSFTQILTSTSLHESTTAHHSSLNPRAHALAYLSHIHHASFQPLDTHPASTANLLIALCTLYAHSLNTLPPLTTSYIHDLLCYFLIDLPRSTLAYIARRLDGLTRHNPQIRFLLDIHEDPNGWLRLTTSTASGPAETSRETHAAFHLHPWELLPEAMPNIGANDAAVDLKLFGARRVS